VVAVPLQVRAKAALELRRRRGISITKPEPPAVDVAIARQEAENEFVSGWIKFASQTSIRSGRRIIPFVPYHYQIELARQIYRHYGTIATKTRQMGFTEFIANLFLYKASINPAYLAVVFSKGQDDTANIARRVRLMASSHSGIELDSANLRDISIKGGGRIVFRPATPNAARGLESVSDILFDECAFVGNIEEIYGSSLPATEMLGDDARIIILSTPNGKNNFYFQQINNHNGDRDILKVCDQVRSGKLDPLQYWTDDDGWCKFICHWKAHPLYSRRPNYLEQVKKKQRISETQLQREYNLSFADSTDITMLNPEWWGVYGRAPHRDRFHRVIQSWDTAQKAKERNNPWACLTFGELNGYWYLIDAFWKRMEYPEGRSQAGNMALKWKPDALLIEDKSTGSSLIQDMRLGIELSDGSKSYFNVIAIEPEGDKETRMSVESPAIEAGRVLLPEYAPWLTELREIFDKFPNGSIKDPVDALSQFLWWARQHPYKPTPDKIIVGPQRGIVRSLAGY
jgi:predicted phage terminase large subunit-like protein